MTFLGRPFALPFPWASQFYHIGQIILLPSTPNITKYSYWSKIPLVILNYLPLTLQAINIVKIKRLVVVVVVVVVEGGNQI